MNRSKLRVLPCPLDETALNTVLGEEDANGYILDTMHSFGHDLFLSFTHESVFLNGLSMVQFHKYNGGSFKVAGDSVVFNNSGTVGVMPGLGLSETFNEIVVTRPGFYNFVGHVHYVCLDAETYVASLRRGPGSPDEVIEDTKNNDHNVAHASVLTIDRVIEVTQADIDNGSRNRLDLFLHKTGADGGVIVDVKLKVLRAGS